MKIIEFNTCSNIDPLESVIFRAEDFRQLHKTEMCDGQVILNLILSIDGNIQKYQFRHNDYIDANEDYFDLLHKLQALDKPNDA